MFGSILAARWSGRVSCTRAARWLTPFGLEEGRMRRAERSAVLVGFAAWAAVALGPRVVGADGWSDVGASGRPSWVRASVERRLRLLKALPDMHDGLNAQANGYFKSDGPGLAVGLVLEDGLYYSEGFGFADAERKDKPDEDTVFRAGSLSKVITGTALLTLVDDPSRHMSLDDAADADHFLPELKFVCPDFDQPCARGSQHLGIRLKHLVSHTAGLANVLETTNGHHGAWLSDLKKSWLLFAPGAFGAYSGVGVEGVGLIEERVSGKNYFEFIRDSLFAPLGMKRSSMDETTLPVRTRAQKWSLAGVSSPNPCREACAVAEGRCLEKADNSTERQACVQLKTECAAACPLTKLTWSFSRVDGRLTGDDQEMLAPAGGLATSVLDLAAFIKMWLSGKAPEVHGRPLLKQATIRNAANSLFSATASPPARCNHDKEDANGFAYSACGTAYGFGVNWYLGDTPYLEHNGSLGVSGSNTRVDQSHKMGATGLVSTNPFPELTPQPSGLNSSFMYTVVNGLLDAARTADAATDWSGRTLADGVARVLYLSGKEPAKSDLDAFTPDFVVANHLGSANVVAFLTDWQHRVGSCWTFRVRDVLSATRIEAALACKRQVWDIVLTVEGQTPHRISWSEIAPAQPSSPDPHHQECLAACVTQEGGCRQNAHSSDQQQACVEAMIECKSECP